MDDCNLPNLFFFNTPVLLRWLYIKDNVTRFRFTKKGLPVAILSDKIWCSN